MPVKHIQLNKIKMKAPRKYNNINKNSITKKDNTQHVTQTQKKKHISNLRWYK